MKRNAYEIAKALMNGGEPRRIARKGDKPAYRTLCPGHDDHHPSLDVFDGFKQVVFFCQSRECSFEDLIKPALIARGLWDKPNETTHYEIIMPVPDWAPEPPESIASRRYTYLDKDGKLLGFVERVDLADGAKDFRPLVFAQSQWTDRDTGKRKRQWIRRSFPEKRPLFKLNELALYPFKPVLVVEGEKAVLAARSMLPDYVVTTWPGGGNAASRADWSPLLHRKIVIWPDADEPGIKTANEIRELLLAQEESADVGIVELPLGLAKGWDAADAKAEGWTAGQMRGLVESNDRALDLEFDAYDQNDPTIWERIETLLKPIPAPYRKRYISRMRTLDELLDQFNE